MNNGTVVGPGEGEVVLDTPAVPMSILEDGSSTQHRFTPDLYVNYFRELRTLAASGQPPSPQKIASVMSRYATQPVTDAAAVPGSETRSITHNAD